MIFVTLGSQKFQFNRLLQEIDRLIENGEIQEPVYAQTGYSDYAPKHYEYQAFMDRDEYKHCEETADIIITHGGTGSIISAVKKGRKVIAVPRLKKYGEHVDDHQIQLIREFRRQNLICGLNGVSGLSGALREVRGRTYDSYHGNTEAIIQSIDSYIESSVVHHER